MCNIIVIYQIGFFKITIDGTLRTKYTKIKIYLKKENLHP